MQKMFSPTDYNFEWTEDWYKWDRDAAHKAALKARNAEAKRLKSEGYAVQKYSRKDQLISKGGIGGDKPHLTLIANCYGLDAH